MRHKEFILEKDQKDDLNHISKLKTLAGNHLDLGSVETKRIFDRFKKAENRVRLRTRGSPGIRRSTAESVTSASSVASVSGNVSTSMQRRNPNGTAVNALDSDTPLMGKKKNSKKSIRKKA